MKSGGKRPTCVRREGQRGACGEGEGGESTGRPSAGGETVPSAWLAGRRGNLAAGGGARGGGQNCFLSVTER